MSNTIALTMIVAAGTDKEAKQLQRALGSVNGYVDAIYIQLNAPKGKKIDPKMQAIAKRFTNFVYPYIWNGSFVAARNDLQSKVNDTYDWIMFLDADDRVENPEMIKPSVAVMPTDVNGIRILYDYQKDEHGNVIVSHWATRVVRNNGSFSWKSSIDDDEVSVHETLIAKRSVRSVANNEWKVVHEAEPGHYKESLIRNIELLEGMYARQSQKPAGVDPRILFYLGSHYNEAYRFKEAKELFYQYLQCSGWAEERAEAHVYMGKILKMEGNLAGARTAFLMAMGENPNNPGAYLELGKLESKAERWEQAADWLKRGIALEAPITAMVRYNHDYELLIFYAQALMNLGGKHLTKAFKVAQKALALRPFDPDAQRNRDSVQELITHRDNLRGVNHLLGELIREEGAVLPFLDSLPESVKDSPLVVTARQRYTPPKKWGKHTVVIYVGQGPLGIWGPWSLNNGGIGGSEEAVVRLSRELCKLGWDVIVYGMPGEKAGYDQLSGDHWSMDSIPRGDMDSKNGAFTPYPRVEWKQYWEFNANDTFDVLISWRQPAFFDTSYKARKTYLWLHDVMEASELCAERLANITKVIYVSKYHSERVENEHIPQAQKFASGNGIAPGDFQKYDNRFKRDTTRCIYMSANERGLRILYDIWPDVKKAVPDATLDTYYGWQSFDAVNKDNPERMAWKASMLLKAKDLEGVTDHGRIGHDDLNKEIFKAGIWAYPSFFPEVNCITAQKAQAGGAWPVTSTFAALDDVVLAGDKLDMGDFTPVYIEQYKQALIHRLQNPPEDSQRVIMMQKARKTFAWKNTAKQWNKEFKEGI